MDKPDVFPVQRDQYGRLYAHLNVWCQTDTVMAREVQERDVFQWTTVALTPRKVQA